MKDDNVLLVNYSQDIEKQVERILHKFLTKIPKLIKVDLFAADIEDELISRIYNNLIRVECYLSVLLHFQETVRRLLRKKRSQFRLIGQAFQSRPSCFIDRFS